MMIRTMVVVRAMIYNVSHICYAITVDLSHTRVPDVLSGEFTNEMKLHMTTNVIPLAIGIYIHTVLIATPTIGFTRSKVSIPPEPGSIREYEIIFNLNVIQANESAIASNDLLDSGILNGVLGHGQDTAVICALLPGTVVVGWIGEQLVDLVFWQVLPGSLE